VQSAGADVESYRATTSSCFLHDSSFGACTRVAKGQGGIDAPADLLATFLASRGMFGQLIHPREGQHAFSPGVISWAQLTFTLQIYFVYWDTAI